MNEIKTMVAGYARAVCDEIRHEAGKKLLSVEAVESEISARKSSLIVELVELLKFDAENSNSFSEFVDSAFDYELVALKISVCEPDLAPPPEAVKEARKAAGLSQNAAAKLVHMKTGTWSAWEQGDREMSPTAWELFLLKTRAM